MPFAPPASGGGGSGGPESDPLYIAGGATDTELTNAIASVNAALANKQASSTAATDAELASAVSDLLTQVDAKADSAQVGDDIAAAIAAHAAGDATDAELSSAIATLTSDLGAQVDVVEASLATHAADASIHSSGRELGYAEITSDFVKAVTSGGTTDDIPGLTVTVTVGARPILVEAFAIGMTGNTANQVTQMRIMEGTNILALARVRNVGAGSADASPYAARRLTPTAGSHTYKVGVWGTVGQTVTVSAASVGGPAFIRVTEG